MNELNSRAWWDEYFRSKWELYGGSERTRRLMETIVAALPEAERQFLSQPGRSILDWGCALGEGVETLAAAFPAARVAGLDVSRVAIEKARARFPGGEFLCSEDGAIPASFDVIVTSNCLAHFEAPLAVMEQLLARGPALLVALEPYNERPLHPQHRAQFRAESFPASLPDFERIHCAPVESDSGEQLLVIYAGASQLGRVENRPDAAALAIARIETLRAAERQRANSAEQESRAARREVEAVRAMLQSERTAWTHTPLASLVAGQRAQLAEKQTQLDAARSEIDSLRLLFADLRSFKVQFEQNLAVYRSEKAWRIMVAIRRAYTLLFRRKAGLRALFGASPAGEFEPLFPDIKDYVPAQLLEPPAQAALSQKPRRSAREHGPERRYDVVIFPVFDFEFRFQRPQQIAAELARRGHRVFWVSPARMLPLAQAEFYQLAPIRENLWELRLRSAPFDIYCGGLGPTQVETLLEGLEKMYSDLAIASSCAIVQFPFWSPAGRGLRERTGATLVYDCMDDWQNWPTDPVPGAFSLHEETQLAREADVVAVTSRLLHDRLAAQGIDSVLIPNAADFDFFRAAQADSVMPGIGGPIVGYYGAIANWFDLELMTQVARSRPQYSFVLIGQVHLVDSAELESLPNVHLLGEKSYEELPPYLRKFDVCTLPFRRNQLTRAVDPVKVYEYLSQGKPVVSVPLPELEPLSGLLYFAGDAADFSRQIDRALEEKGDRRESRIAFASENTWRARVDVLDRAIRARYPLVSLLVVTYNSREFLEPFFDSLRANTSYPSYEVIVVDNHSNDGTADVLKSRADDPRIQVYCLEENLGFAGGNNYAARMSKGEYLLLLNPDVLLTAGWLETLMERLRADPTIGLVGPVTNYSGNETKVNTGYRDFGEMKQFAANLRSSHRGRSFDIAVLPMFCTLLRRKLWDEAGGLDECYQVGMFEDDDFAMRVRQLGYRVVVAEDCFIHHFGSGSFAKLPSSDYHAIWERNRKLYEAKWNTAWKKHTTRPGIAPVGPDNQVPFARFFEEESPVGA